jgi:hypothetical protein
MPLERGLALGAALFLLGSVAFIGAISEWIAAAVSTMVCSAKSIFPKATSPENSVSVPNRGTTNAG